MIGMFENIRIGGISVAVPCKVEENILAADYLGARRCKKQIKLTGIERRHVSPVDQKMSDLCYVAAKKLIEHLKWNTADIKVLVLLTQNPNYIAPSTAFLLHKMLGLSKECVVFDVNLGCSSFNVGLQIVGSLLQQFPGNAKGICLQGDLAYNTVNPSIPPDAMAGNLLFGSAGSATALEKTVNKVSPISYATYSDGTRYEAILRKKNTDSVHMDGEGVFNFTVNDVVNDINAFKEATGLNEDNIDFYVFHQAQKLILDNVATLSNISEQKELRSLKDYGNTSGASVPLSICSNIDSFNNRKNVNMFTCGFGIGLSWSMAYINLETANILPVIYTDEVFEG